MFDEWSGLADLFANLIEKYATVLDIENMPDIIAKNRIEDERNKTKKEWKVLLARNGFLRYNKS